MTAQRQSIIDLVKSWSPVSDRIIILPDEKDAQTKSGIFLTQTKKDDGKRQSGLVLCVGPGRISDHGAKLPQEVAPGDRILFKKYAGDELLVNDDGSTEAYVGEPPRDHQILINFIRADSVLCLLP